MTFMRKIPALCILAYQRCISPFLPPACRFQPTCSEYARQAIARFGIVHGGALALRRLARCNPLFKGGYDPLPEPRTNPADVG